MARKTSVKIARTKNAITTANIAGTAGNPAADARTGKPAKLRKAKIKNPDTTALTSSVPSASKKPSPAGSRKPAKSDSKKDAVLALLGRKSGATLSDLAEATGWQSHSVRGFLSGTVKKKLGLKLASDKPEGGERRYFVRGQS